jgi:hypothetical protein
LKSFEKSEDRLKVERESVQENRYTCNKKINNEIKFYCGWWPKFKLFICLEVEKECKKSD